MKEKQQKQILTVGQRVELEMIEQGLKKSDYYSLKAVQRRKINSNIMTNTSILKVYTFSGNGNFSQSFGWDNGLSCSLGESTTWKRAHECENAQHEGGFLLAVNLPRELERGIFWQSNEHGGSRNVVGYVVANSRRDARKQLAEFEQNWEVVAYEQD